ncbi:MAG: extracellular solute-binding protein [Muribaculaceae bacterium]|nr:extracellular solute-binding protein [Alistipes senegalensis]MCM1473949.1 extracellular solute-binding protein [Muribaculaceae bacterium]
MKNKFLFRIIIFIFIIFFVPAEFPAYSAGLLYDEYYPIEKNNTEISYSRYYDIYSAENRPESIIEVIGSDYISAENGTFSVRENILIWESSTGEISYNIDVQETGIYCMNMTYFPLKSETSSIEFSLSIDGKKSYDTASRITLNKVWVNEKEISTDSHGNQIRSAQVQKEMWKNSDLMDVDGLFSEPLIFYLEKGHHEIKFSSERAYFALEKFKFYNPEKLPTYKEYISGADINTTPENIFRIEGENAVCKSDRTLYPTCDNSHYNVSPADPVKILYNTFGGGNWKKPLQSATWTIPKEEIKNDGWYKIGIKYRQNEIRGFSSNRRIYIDDKVLCDELNNIKFSYNKKWEILSPQADNENIYIYLTADRDHTITMECVTGEIGEYIRHLNDIVSEINGYYRKILMITGTSPDKYTDYYVHEKIPDLLENFQCISSELKNIQSGIEKISDSSGSEAYVLENMTVILDKCIKKPLKIPEYLSQIKTNIISLSAWSLECRNQPLEIDYIEFATSGVEFSSCKENFFKKIWFAIRAFFGSFFEDYSELSDVSGENVIEVWVDSEREQAEIVREMTESFTEKTGIPVSVNLVTGGIIEASLAGKSPDIALFSGGGYPVSLAMRGMLADVSQFDDYADVSGRFQENAMTHYQYNGGVYGIPITQNFPLLFYRTDILTEIGYTSPPETWDNLIDILPALQRNYMSAGLVLPSTDVSPSTETGHTFALLMLQRGVNYYNSGLDKSNFDTIQATEAFEIWTDFYTEYSLEQSYDAFSRFRTGEYPLVIADCSFYGQLTDVAPEIKGLWNFCPVPATVINGEVTHTANSNVSGAVIFNDTENLNSAWEYVKWFTETETQVNLCSQTEGLFGTMGRLYTANTEAFKKLSWSDDELSRLFAQREELEEIPIIPASYSVTRNIMNAFREVVNRNLNPRDTLLWYNNDINDEIFRKNKNIRER